VISPDVVAALLDEHRAIERALEPIHSLVDAPRTQSDPHLEQALQRAFDLIERHAAREESELFPQLSGAAKRFADTMEGEHWYLRSLMQRVIAAEARDPAATRALYLELRDLLARHFIAEELELFTA
jgi:hemerythrin-like domain-containing protein